MQTQAESTPTGGTPFTRLSPVLEQTDHGDGSFGMWFLCPGCKMNHRVMIGTSDKHGPRWEWDGNKEKPTFSPSVLVRYNWGPEQKSVVCHSFVRQGRIEFLSDCTHEFAGQTVDLPREDEVEY